MRPILNKTSPWKAHGSPHELGRGPDRVSRLIQKYSKRCIVCAVEQQNEASHQDLLPNNDSEKFSTASGDVATVEEGLAEVPTSLHRFGLLGILTVKI